MDDKDWEVLKKAMRESRELRMRLFESSDLGDRLYYQLCYSAPRDTEGWMKLYGQVHEYLKGDNPEERKSRLMQYTEMLAMMKEAAREVQSMDIKGIKETLPGL